MSSIMGGGPVVRHGIRVGGGNDVMGTLVSSLTGCEADELFDLIGSSVGDGEKRTLVAAVLGLELFDAPFSFPNTTTLDQLSAAMILNTSLVEKADELVGNYF